MRILFLTCSPSHYMAPPQLGDEQIVAGPDWPDAQTPEGKWLSLRTPVGSYDLAVILARIPADQYPDAVVSLVDASWRNQPRNIAAFRGPKALLVADTHHLNSPLIGMFQYASAERYDRIVFLYDRHHLGFFRSAGFDNLYWFPGLTLPHDDATVRAARAGRREARIAFVGQAGKFHPQRARLLESLQAAQLPVEPRQLAQRTALGFYGSSLLAFNASLNGDLNLRVFESLATGTALLTDRLAPESGLLELFADGRELITYGSAEELVERAAHALAQPRETAAIGAAGAAWFDVNFNAAVRRAAFSELVINGTPVPAFAAAQRESRVYFPGNTDRLIESLVVYETVQEWHRAQTVTRLHLAPGVSGDIAAAFATLPRLVQSTGPLAEAADLVVLGANDAFGPELAQAAHLWCPGAATEEAADLSARWAGAGFIRINPDFLLFRRLALADQRLEAAEAAFGANDTALVAGLIQSIFALDSRHVGGLLLAARLALRLQDTGLVQEVLALIRTAAPGHADLPALEQAAIALANAGSADAVAEAEAAANSAVLEAYTRLKESPTSADSWRLLARALAEAGKAREALGAINRAMTLEAGRAEDRLVRADILTGMNRDAEALNDLQLAALAQPRDASVQAALAKKALLLKLGPLAREAITRGKEIDPRAEVFVQLEQELAASAPGGIPDEGHDLLITHNEICRLHGTGVLIERYFTGMGPFVALRSHTHYDGKTDLPGTHLVLESTPLSAEQEQVLLRQLLGNFKIRRILCVPFYEEDCRRALLARRLTGAPLCAYVMDDQTVHAQGITPAGAQALFAGANLRLAISPEMRTAYEKKFDLPFDVMPPLLTSTTDRLANAWEPVPGESVRAALVGNIWSAQQFAQLRRFVRAAGIQLDWFGNANTAWLPANPKEYEDDGIFARGFIPEAELARKLVQYPFVVVPSGQLDGSEKNEWLTRLSLPSRMVFILGQAQTPMLVVGHADTAAARFVSNFGLGAVVPYDAANVKAAIQPLVGAGARRRILANIARHADKFVLANAGAWIWRSLEAGAAQPAPFRELYAEPGAAGLPGVAEAARSLPAPRTGVAVVRPQTLNLQAIDVCNSRCVMCNIWKDGRKETMSIEELRVFLSTSFFSEVRHVGITGGEPTLRKDLVDLYKLLPECLPALTGASFISHGMQTVKAVGFYTEVNNFYRARGLEFSGMISLDGVGAMHDSIRGKKDAFASASATLLALKQAGVKVIAACTIVRRNVYGLHDLLAWGREHGIYVRFRVAEFIRRLYNEGCADQIRAFSDREVRHLVCFFHVLLEEYEREEPIRRTYTSILELLTGGERLIGCPYQRGAAVNINSRGELASCAPKGDSFAVGDDEADTHTTLAASREAVTKAHCTTCIHDYHDAWNSVAKERRAAAQEAVRKLYEVPDDKLTAAEVPAAALPLERLSRILLIGWYGTETAGDIAILRGIIAEYLAVNPKLSFGVLSLYPTYTKTTVAAWPADLRARVTIADFNSREALDSARHYDAVVMAGGPLMDIPDTKKILALFKLFADRRKPCVIEGCGVGPLNQPNLRWNVTRIARLATQISVRDSASRDLLRFYGIRKAITVRADPASTFLRAQSARHHGTDKGVIRCFLRELTSEYPQAVTPAQATENLARLLGRLLEWYPEHRLELWAMHHFPVGKDDRLFARELERRVANPRLSVQWEPSTPEEVVAAMAAAEFCVCMRFHSCVFAAEVGVPFLAIDYTAGGKIRGFLEDNRKEHRLCSLADLDGLTRDTFAAKVWPVPAAATQVEVTPLTPARPRVLHVIQGLTGGGGARAMLSLAKYSRQLDGPDHAVVSLQRADAKGLELAAALGMTVLDQPGARELHRALAEADIVLVHWWTCPELSAFFRRDLPPLRLATWIHVGGYHAPYVLQPELVNFVDSAVACSPHTFAHPAFRTLPKGSAPQRGKMILAGAEFARVENVVPRAHEGFRVGYIGTLDPTKMHAGFVDMSCAARIPGVRFITCGGGGSDWLVKRAEQLGRSDSFEFPGAVEDIREVLATLDVYGYPLCEDTYAAAELNVQEVMYAGVPIVAFPHGGLATLIQHEETGLLVHSADEYAAALEFLHQNPAERARLGANAAAYAREHFGAERTGREFNAHFAWLLTQPKRERQWGTGAGFPRQADPARELAINPGARFFVEAIGERAARDYLASLGGSTPAEQVAADSRLGKHSLLTHYTCAVHFLRMFPGDPWLNFWAGIGHFARGNYSGASNSLLAARRRGHPDWRAYWYGALAAEKGDDARQALAILGQLMKLMPGMSEARAMHDRLSTALAGECMSEAIALSQVQAEIQRAQQLLRSGRHREARQLLEKASALVPNQLALLELMADLDCRLGNFPSARLVLERILAQEPARATARVLEVQRRLAQAAAGEPRLATAS